MMTRDPMIPPHSQWLLGKQEDRDQLGVLDERPEKNIESKHEDEVNYD